MGRHRENQNDEDEYIRIRPQIEPEGRLQQMVALATNLAEKQLIEGTASSQVITHYLKLGTEQAKLERLLLEEQVKLAAAKTAQIEAAQYKDTMYEEALAAFRRYGGHLNDESELPPDFDPERSDP